MSGYFIKRPKKSHRTSPESNPFDLVMINGNSLEKRPYSIESDPFQQYKEHGVKNGMKKVKNLKSKPKLGKVGKKDSVGRFILKTTETSNFVGLNKIGASRTLFGRLLWIVLTLICLTGFLYQGLKFAVVFSSLPTEVILHVENSGTLHFPSVTMCNYNRIRKKAYCEQYPDVCPDNFTKLQLSEKEISDAYFEALKTGRDRKQNMGHSNGGIYKCVFEGVKNDINTTQCLSRLTYAFDTQYGNCYTLHSKDENTSEYLSSTETDIWQKRNDLLLLLDDEADEHTETVRPPGFLLTIHSDEYDPDISTDSIYVESGFYYSLSVQQSVTTLLPAPYSTNCTNFNNLPWVKTAILPSPRICTVGCSRYFQMEKCGFVTREISMFYNVLPWNPFTITDEQEKCASDEMENSKSYCRSVCSVPCKNTYFEVDVSKNEIQENEVLQFYPDVKDLPSNWKKLILVKIFYKSIEKKMYEHMPMHDDLSFFSHMGGYSGVWLGFSLLNLCELVEIIFLSVRYACCRSKTRSRERDIFRNDSPSNVLKNGKHRRIKYT